MEIILQKATELGVSKITPVISERTEVKELNHERANKIVIEATEQSNQLSPPEISKITPAAIAPIACPPLTKGSVIPLIAPKDCLPK